MTRRTVFGLEPATYVPHALHAAERIWPESNCSVDLWIEVLNAAGCEPRAMLGFTLAQDFEGDQFTFFKAPLGDLERLYGIQVEELSVFDRLEGHILTQIVRGRLVMVELDAHFLPDTAGVTYRIGHSKTTVGIDHLDPVNRRMTYFHNGGFHELAGADYDGHFGPEAHRAGGLPLFPYAEYAKFGRHPASADLVGDALHLLAHHLKRRPVENPFRAWARHFAAEAADLATRPPEYFHIYAFNTPRQFGANFELLASHLDWLGDNGVSGLAAAATEARAIATTAKTFQFKLARAMARQKFDGLDDLIATAARHWDALMAALDATLPASRPASLSHAA